ncbi:hypothetical protein D3C80_878410 [compost metagenome]
MIEDKAFKAMLTLYISEADHVHMKEPETYGDYTYLIQRSDYNDEAGSSEFLVMEMTETGSDKFKIEIKVSLGHDGTCCGSHMYIHDIVVKHDKPDDLCQKRMGQLFLKRALMPFTQFVYYAVGIKACL